MIFQTFGDVGYVQISSLRLEERIRSRYKSEIDQLLSLGFIYRFSVGQTFPILNLILIVPAIVLLMMLWRREVITFRGGTEFLVASPIYSKGEITAFAQPMGLGIVFKTAFQYGAGLTPQTLALATRQDWDFKGRR